MISGLPITVLAQLGDVTVFQTAAFQTPEHSSQKPSQQRRQTCQPSYGELNLGLHVNDDAAKVLTNRMRLLAAMNNQLATQQRLSIKSLHWVNQVHGKQVHDIDATTLGMHPMTADAMISQQAELGLAIMTADCVPIVLYQPASGQLAAIHAGWQGLACGIIKATAERFSAAEQIMAWIGVCISQAHYEVGNQVRDQLLTGCAENQLLTPSSIDNFNQLFCVVADADRDAVAHIGRLNNTVDNLTNSAKVGTDKVKLNLSKLAAYQLAAAGVTVDKEFPIACSYADTRYYSYRRQTHLQQPATGRMALIIVHSSPVTDINHN